MYTDILRHIAGIAVFPVVSLVTFVLFFGGMLIWTSRLDSRKLSRLSRLPLEESTREIHS
jgi:hypothetical protein